MFQLRHWKKKLKKKNRASLHDFLVLFINGHCIHCQFSRTSGIIRIQEINEDNCIHIKFEEHKCTPVFFLSYPKAYYSLIPIKRKYYATLLLPPSKKKKKKRNGRARDKKTKFFVQKLANISELKYKSRSGQGVDI